jgi:hypothetical protein
MAFTIYITPIVTGNDLKHVATSWQVARDSTFSDDSLLVNDLKDENNLLSLKVELPLTSKDVYYTRYKLHFDNDKETAWSRPSVVTKDGDGFSFNNTIIITPRLSVDINPTDAPLGDFKIYGSEFKLFMGTGNHKSTDWIIEDSEGNIVWQRLGDVHNLTSIKLPSDILDKGKMYVVKCRYNSDTNSYSNYGKLYLVTQADLVNGTYGTKMVTDNIYIMDRLPYLTGTNNDCPIEDVFTQLVACTIANSLCY